MQLSCQNQYRAIAVGAAEPREVNLEDLGIGVEMEILYWQIHPGFKYHVEPCEKNCPRIFSGPNKAASVVLEAS